MADEVNLSFQMKIRKTSDDGSIVLIDEGRGNVFQASVGEGLGPVPGKVRIPDVTGKSIDMSELSVPGICTIKNMDDTNYVVYGIKEPATGKFYPWGDLLPGEEFPFRFSRFLGEEFIGAGTGTDPTPNEVFFLAIGGPVVVYIGAYEYGEDDL